MLYTSTQLMVERQSRSCQFVWCFTLSTQSLSHRCSTHLLTSKVVEVQWCLQHQLKVSCYSVIQSEIGMNVVCCPLPQKPIAVRLYMSSEPSNYSISTRHPFPFLPPPMLPYSCLLFRLSPSSLPVPLFSFLSLFLSLPTPLPELAHISPSSAVFRTYKVMPMAFEGPQEIFKE